MLLGFGVNDGYGGLQSKSPTFPVSHSVKGGKRVRQQFGSRSSATYCAAGVYAEVSNRRNIAQGATVAFRADCAVLKSRPSRFDEEATWTRLPESPAGSPLPDFCFLLSVFSFGFRPRFIAFSSLLRRKCFIIRELRIRDAAFTFHYSPFLIFSPDGSLTAT
jgi:hypothetical protein